MKKGEYGCIRERKRPGRDSLDDTAGKGNSEPDRVTRRRNGERVACQERNSRGADGVVRTSIHLLSESRDGISRES